MDRIRAIKIVRETTGCDLRTAKETIDKIIPPPFTRSDFYDILSPLVAKLKRRIQMTATEEMRDCDNDLSVLEEALEIAYRAVSE